MDEFIDGSKPIVAGWISFYWGETIEEYRGQKLRTGDAITLKWLEYYQTKRNDLLLQ